MGPGGRKQDFDRLVVAALEEKLARKHQTDRSTSKGAKPQKWMVGERITVIKEGSQTGQKGTVENPEWQGRVKVRLHNTGAIKSYANNRAEIRKDNLGG